MKMPHFAQIKPLSINRAYTVFTQKKGRKSFSRIGKTQEAKNFEAVIKFLLPKPEEVELFDKMTLHCKIYYTNKRSDLDNPLKFFIDALQKRLGFDDCRIYKIVTEKFIVEDEKQEGFYWQLTEYKEEKK